MTTSTAYTYKVECRVFLESVGLIVPQSYRTTDDALGLSVDACKRRHAAGEIDSYTVSRIDSGEVVAHGNSPTA